MPQSNPTHTVSIYHLPATGTTEYPASPNVSADGDLIPLDRYAHTLEGGAYQNPHELYVYDTSVDLRVNDKLVVRSKRTGASSVFYVKHVFTADLPSRMAHHRATVSTER